MTEHSGKFIDDVYNVGVRSALKPITFEEAISCGFPEPYSLVTNPGPLSKLFELRQSRLVRKMDENS